VPTCVVGIVFFFFFHPSELNCSAAGFIPNMASNAFPLLFFFLDFYSVVVVVFFFPKKTTEMSALPWRSTWHQMT
jgi:hypothetical protein